MHGHATPNVYSSIPLPCRYPAHAPPSMAMPCHSIRLAKKAMGRSPVIVAAQNLLMRKLGLFSSGVEEVQGFKRYVNMFVDGLTEEQAHIIDELFMCHVPLSEPVRDEDVQ
jgi:hypothetical protein